MTDRTTKFTLYLNTPELGVIEVAKAGLLERQQVLVQIDFRYVADYLAHPHAFALDPINLPLSPKIFSFLPPRGHLPGILDDYLPDDWGKKVLTRLAFYRSGQKLNANSPLDLLALMGNSRIGALQWCQEGEKPNYELGASFEQLHQAEETAQALETGDYGRKEASEFSLVYLANSGSGVGGARPKTLVYKDNQAYLAKFNSFSRDRYNNARVELACIYMAQQAGIEMRSGHVVSGINNREVLLLNRFDVVANARKHLITVNSLLKQPDGQDNGHPFRYDDIASLIQKISDNPKHDLLQLLRIMLFNRAINNLDDHERNFSFWHTGKGYQLAPAYDLVPSLTRGEYPVAGYGYSPFPPALSEVKGQVFGLSKPDVMKAVEQIKTSLECWHLHAEKAGVSAEDQSNIESLFCL